MSECSCELCRAEARLSEDEIRLMGKIFMEKVEETGVTLPFRGDGPADRFMVEHVLPELDRRIATKAG